MMGINGRAETDQQKRAIIERLFVAWCSAPSLRLGQLIENVFNRDVYYIEDEQFIEQIEQLVLTKERKKNV